jgi:putative inorganic carbon (hco3(-)) transporter
MTSLVAFDSVRQPPRILGALVTGYVALLPYQFQVASGVNFAPADCFMLLVLLLAPGQLKYSKPAWSFWHFALAVTFTTGSLVAAVRFGVLDRYELLNKDIGLLLPFLSYVAVTSLVSGWEDVRKILRVFVLTVVTQNIFSISGFLLAYFFHIENPFTRYGGLRLSGMLLDPNAYGGLLVAAFVICEGASLGPAPLFKGPMLWFFRLSLAMGLLFTFSRSAWSALALALLLLCMVHARATIRLMLTGMVAAPCLFLLMGSRFLPVFEEMAARPKQVQGRFDLIHDAYQAFTLHPFVGGGIGSFRMSEGEIAHNTAMWFLADFGIPGLVVLLGFVGWFFAKAWFAYRNAPGRDRSTVLSLLLAHTAMFGLAMGIEAFYQRHWWLVMGLIGASYSLTLAPQSDRGIDPHGAPRGDEATEQGSGDQHE